MRLHSHWIFNICLFFLPFLVVTIFFHAYFLNLYTLSQQVHQLALQQQHLLMQLHSLPKQSQTKVVNEPRRNIHQLNIIFSQWHHRGQVSGLRFIAWHSQWIEKQSPYSRVLVQMKIAGTYLSLMNFLAKNISPTPFLHWEIPWMIRCSEPLLHETTKTICDPNSRWIFDGSVWIDVKTDKMPLAY